MFKLASIIFVPTVTIALYFTISLTIAGFSTILYSDGSDYEIDRFLLIAGYTEKVFGYWTTIINIVTCILLGMTLRFVNNLTQRLTSTAGNNIQTVEI